MDFIDLIDSNRFDTVDKDLSIKFDKSMLNNWSATHVRMFEKESRSTNALFLYTGGLGAEYTLPDGTTLSVSKGDLVYLPIGAHYTVKLIPDPTNPSTKTLDYISVLFIIKNSSGKLCRLYDKVTLISHDAGRWRPIFDKIHELYSLNGSRLKINSLLYELVDSVIDTPPIVNTDKKYAVVAESIRFISDNWNRNPSVTKLAEQNGMSVQYFRRLFKEYVGCTPSDYCQSVILDKTKHMLLSTEMSINDVGCAAGFTDQFYFSRFFKRKVGMSPFEYRKKYKVESPVFI